MQGGRFNQAFRQQSIAVTLNAAVFDLNIWQTAGYINIHHRIFRLDGTVAMNWSGAYWLGSFPQRHQPAFWHSIFNATASQLIPNYDPGEPYLYRPSIAFAMWGPGGSDLAPVLTEFAVVEEDIYFSISA
jgi:hypothetical protein